MWHGPREIQHGKALSKPQGKVSGHSEKCSTSDVVGVRLIV